MDERVLKYLADKINEDIERLKEDLSMGGAKDHAAYTNVAGKINGLRTALGYVVDTMDRLRKGEDE